VFRCEGNLLGNMPPRGEQHRVKRQLDAPVDLNKAHNESVQNTNSSKEETLGQVARLVDGESYAQRDLLDGQRYAAQVSNRHLQHNIEANEESVCSKEKICYCPGATTAKRMLQTNAAFCFFIFLIIN
jgi:hypothetical protein